MREERANILIDDNDISGGNKKCLEWKKEHTVVTWINVILAVSTVQGSVLTKSHTVTPKLSEDNNKKLAKQSTKSHIYIPREIMYLDNIAALRFTFSLDVNTQKIGKGRCSAEKKEKSH